MSERDAEDRETIEARLERVEKSLSRIEAHLLGPEQGSNSQGEQRQSAGAKPEAQEGKDKPVEGWSAGRASAGKKAKEKPKEKAKKKGKERSKETSKKRGMETWLNRLGMALVLVGLVFLYRLSEELGLLVDPVRVGLGIGLGGVLGGIGWWLQERRRGLSRICLGGSLAAFYITFYAAYQLYELVPHTVAFGAMSVVTMGAFGMAYRWNAITLSVVGAIGGFATPLMLSTSSGNLAGLSIYNGLLVTGMVAIYLLRGWKHLLGLTAVGGWALAWLGSYIYVSGEVSTAAFGVWLGSLFVVWAAVGLIPVLRRWLLDVSPVNERVVGAVALLTPPALLGALRWAWVPDGVGWLPLYVVAALGMAGLAKWLEGRLEKGSALVGVHRLVVVGLVAMALVDAFEGLSLMAALSVEVAVVHVAAKKLNCQWLRWIGHGGAAIVVMLLWEGLWEAMQWGRGIDVGQEFDIDDPFSATHKYKMEPLGMPVGDVVSMVVAVAGLYASRWGLGRLDGPSYMLVAQLHYMAMVVAVGFSYGEVSYVVTALWALVAVVTLAWGVIRDVPHLRWLGMAAVMASVMKLVFFDLNQADTLWRVAIFVGLGVALLVISYFSPEASGPETGAELDVEEM